MKVFVTGATGGIGSAVVPELLTAGHEVTALTRSERSARHARELGATALPGDLTDLDIVRRGAEGADAVVHLAFSNDFGNIEAGMAEESAAVHALGDGLTAGGRGDGRTFVFASGTPAVPGRTATEEDPTPTDGPMGARGATAEHVLSLAELGVRGVAVRLPRSVHQAGVRYGFASMLIDAARRSGVSGFVGDGSQRWPAVHILDAARLFRLALEGAATGPHVHAVADEGDSMRSLAEAIGQELDLPVRSVPAESFGFLGSIFAVDQPANSARTRETSGWEPVHPSLLEDLRAGGYPEG